MPSGEKIVVLLLGAGGATFIWTVVRSYLAIRGAAETREAVAIRNLERWRDEADRRAQVCHQRLEVQTDFAEFWRFRASDLEHQLHLNGVPVPPLPPRPRTWEERYPQRDRPEVELDLPKEDK